MIIMAKRIHDTKIANPFIDINIDILNNKT